MSARVRILVLAVTMSAVAAGGTLIALGVMYQTTAKEERARLVETVQSQARLLEAVARFDALHSAEDVEGGAFEATLQQMRDAHAQFEGFGKTGDFTLAQLEDGQIVFLLNHGHGDLNRLQPVPMDSELAEPMRLALQGKSGTVVGLDYRGVRVLAAYEPVAVLNLGMVAKIDLSEIRAPFVRATFLAALGSVILVAVGMWLFFRVGTPMVQHLGRQLAEIRQAEGKQRELAFDLGERIKDLSCLYSVAELVADRSLSLEEILHGTVERIPPGWQYPEATCARISVEGQAYQTEGFKETAWRQAADIVVADKSVGALEVYYLEEKPQRDEGPFLGEERSLIDAIAERLGHVIEQKRSEQALQQIEWLLSTGMERRLLPLERYQQPYGDLVALNTSRLLVDSVGKDVLADAVGDILDLLGTSAAVYERNGDYAFGMFSSGWCRFLDAASRDLCGTDDDREALRCGKWLCHESCWSDASKKAIDTGRSVDVECRGGLRLHAVPIWAGESIAGSINFGYGDPPRDPQRLQEIAEEYGVAVDELAEQAARYESRPPFIIELTKRRLPSAARLIGEICERRRAEIEVQQHREHLEERVTERTLELAEANVQLRAEIEERQRLEREVIGASEVERRRIGADIHDGLGQHLTAVSLKAEVLAQQLAGGEVPEAAAAEEIEAMVRDAISTTRSLAHGLSPGALDNQGLMLALEELAAMANDAAPQIRCTFACHGRDRILNGSAAIHLYRIAQEAVNNALKHAKADRIELVLSRAEEETTLTVRDNGEGMPEAAGDGEGMGIRIMRHRARMIGGRCEMRNMGERGTLVTCTCSNDALEKDRVDEFE